MSDEIYETQEPFIDRIHKKFKEYSEIWDRQYKLSMEEMLFLTPEGQWPADLRNARTGKPTIASDRLNAQIKQICNQQRENRPAINVHAVNNEADEDCANVIQGLMRHIEYESKADLAYDLAFEHAVQGGIGYIRLRTEFEPGKFDQHVIIEPIPNPFLCLPDPHFKQIDGSDIEDCFLVDYLTFDEFKEQYPDAEMSKVHHYGSWLPLSMKNPDWFDRERKSTVVVEYLAKEYMNVPIVKLKSGAVKDKAKCSDKELKNILAERIDKRPIVKWYKICCNEILEETEWIGQDIPVIPVFGDCILANGQRIYGGIVRNSKETQSMLNIVKTVTLELIAKAPKNPWIVAEGSIDDHKDEWSQVNQLDLPYLTYKVQKEGDPNPLPPPQRQVAEPPVQGMLAVMNILENDIKATNAMWDPTMGEKMSNDQSGMAIKALQTAGSVAHYNFSDNLTRALRILGKQLLYLIPKIYSEERVIRIIGIDDEPRLVTINGVPVDTDNATGEDREGVAKVFDITVGEYDVTVDSGPSFQTKREENLNKLLTLAARMPQLMGVAGDIIASQMDFPAAPKLVERLEKALPPQLQPKPKDGQQDTNALNQQLQQAHQIIQQLTQTLQQETQLADVNQLKLKIAQLNAQTEIQKHQSSLQHDSNKALLESQMAELKEKGANSHELLKLVADHVLKKDREKHAAGLDMISAAQDAIHATHHKTHEAMLDMATQAAQAQQPQEPMNETSE